MQASLSLPSMFGSRRGRHQIDFVLRPGDVHVWASPLDLESQSLAQLRQALSASESAVADRLASPADGRRSAASRGILRALLARYAGSTPRELEIVTGRYGKPALLPLPHAPDIRFNVAHASGHALFAFALDHEIGIDLEEERPVPETVSLIQEVFRPNEAAAIQSVEPAGQPVAFARLWARKEAVIKALGTGFSLSPLAFEAGEEGSAIELVLSGERRQLTVVDIESASGFRAALAAESASPPSVRWLPLVPSLLLEDT